MKVAELIKELQACPQDADVYYFRDFDDCLTIGSVSPEDVDGNVLIGHRLPAECYARDGKYARDG